jgi:hypothetical protein
MRVLVGALCALAACTYDEKVFEGPFTCFGAPAPTTAERLVNIHGHVFEPKDLSPIANATVMLQNAQMMSVFNPVTTDATGAFSFAFNTNGTPAVGLDLLASASGRTSMYFYPTRAVTADIDEEIALLSPPEVGSLGTGGNVTLPDPANGAALLTIADCNGSFLAGAVVTTSPAGVVRYFKGVQVSSSTTETDGGGVALVAELPPGPVTVTVTVQGMTLPTHMITSVANTLMQTTIEPAN